MNGLLYRCHFRSVDHRRLGDGFFDFLQRTSRIGQSDGIAGLRGSDARGRILALLLLFGYNGIAVRALDGRDRLRR